MHPFNCFLTLTYDPKLYADHDLVLGDFQTFIKALRYHYKGQTYEGPREPIQIRYYHCGEYDEEDRAHYHCILFGWDFHIDRKKLKTSKHGDQLWISETLSELWGKGFCSIGAATYKSAGYVARYIMKKQLGDNAEQAYQRVDRATGEVFQVKAPYTTMSRRPGIGASWLERYRSDVFPSDEVIVAGRSTRPPRYYDTQQAKHDPLDQSLRSINRSLNATRYAANNTPERLAVRETVHLARMRRNTRDMP